MESKHKGSSDKGFKEATQEAAKKVTQSGTYVVAKTEVDIVHQSPGHVTEYHVWIEKI
ncbi:MAG: hypothetical protein H0U03_03410 [Actinobacteria bacterium]|nr:hypothetical protein [Actinomycetota bacterium]